MRIALDYDGTYTRDPTMWAQFIELARGLGHEVVCVTQRFEDDPEECLPEMPCHVFYTNRQPKARVLRLLGCSIDIWIDDNPQWVFASPPSVEHA